MDIGGGARDVKQANPREEQVNLATVDPRDQPLGI